MQQKGNQKDGRGSNAVQTSAQRVITLSVHSGAGISCQLNTRRCRCSDWTQNYCRKSLKRVICQHRLLLLLSQTLECRSRCTTAYFSIKSANKCH